MAKLYFNFSAMNAGKSTILLQASHNYIERGMNTFLLTAGLDDRDGKTGQISSRIGIAAPASCFAPGDNLHHLIMAHHASRRIDCVLVDEAQFLEPDQVWQLAAVADDGGIPVMCYGLRTDFKGQLFPGSAMLLAISDDIREIRAICWCGRKATMVARLGPDGRPVEDGDQVEIGGNEKYISLCRKHWQQRDLGSS
ncbi:thymidine kinase [Alphaproteobacteria bacterium LSUCC0684]